MSYKLLLVSNNTIELEKAISLLNGKYDVITSTNAEDSIEIIKNIKIDIIFSDVKIAFKSGKTLLSTVKEYFPDIIRIILGENKEDTAAFKAVQSNTAMICIIKPYEESILTLTSKILQTYENLKELEFFSYLVNLQELPTIRASYQRILELIDDDGEIKDIASAIESDPSMAAKLLRLANSAYYGVRTSSVNEAIRFLGTKSIRSLVLSTSVFDMLNNSEIPEKEFQPLWQQAFMCSKIVTATYKLLKKTAPAHASLSGLLMNIGIIFLLRQFNKRYMNMIQEIKQLNDDERILSIENLEIDVFGSSHSVIGGYLLNWWQIPYPIIEGAIYHNNPLNENVIDKELLCILHLADHYSSKTIYMDCSINYVEDSLKYLGLTKDNYENKIKDLLIGY